MAEVEDWLQKQVFPQITMAHADGKVQEIEFAYANAVKLIKEKLLESYKNGVKAKTKM